MLLNRSFCRRCGLAVTLLVFISGCGAYRWQWPLVRVCPLCPMEASPYAVLPSPNGSVGTNYLQSGPVLAGTDFAAPQQKQASERALELQRENDQLKTQNEGLQHRVAELGREHELNDKALLRAEEEVEHAHQDLSAMHNELESWRSEMLNLHARLRNSDQEHLQSLDQVSSLLNNMLQQQQQSTSVEESQSAPAPPPPAPTSPPSPVPMPMLPDDPSQEPSNL